MSGRCLEFHGTFIQNHSFRVSYFDSITNSHTKILSKANDYRIQRNGFPDIATLNFFAMTYTWLVPKVPLQIHFTLNA